MKTILTWLMVSLLITSSQLVHAGTVDCPALAEGKTLTAEHFPDRQKVVFFASWCVSCKNHILESDASQSIYVIAYDDIAPALAALRVLKPEADLCLSDPKGAIRRAYQVGSLPASRPLLEKAAMP